MNRIAVVATVVGVGVGGFFAGRLSSGRQGAADDPSPPVAEWAGGRITLAELKAWLETKPQMLRAEYLAEPQRSALCNELIDVTLLAEEARRKRLDLTPRVKVRLDELLAAELLAAETRSSSSSGEADLRAYYDAHRPDFERPRQLKLRMIAFNRGDEATASSALEKLRTELKTDPLAFVRTAQTLSVDSASRANGGDLGDHTVSELESILGATAAAEVDKLPAGSLSGVLEGPTHLHVVYVEAVRPAASASFDAVRGVLGERAQAEKAVATRQRLTKEVRDRAAIKIDESRLKSLAPEK